MFQLFYDRSYDVQGISKQETAQINEHKNLPVCYDPYSRTLFNVPDSCATTGRGSVKIVFVLLKDHHFPKREKIPNISAEN